MNRPYRLSTRNTRYWIYLFLGSVFLIWIFQQIFFSMPPSENISALSYQRKGNKVFFQYLEEKRIAKEILYEPSYVWVKEMIKKTEHTFNYLMAPEKLKYIFVEKEKSFFWASSEREWFKRYLESGNEIIIFTLNPKAYWEALMLPVEFEDMEKKKKAQYHFPTGFEISLKEIVKDFLYQSVNTSNIQNTQEAKAQRCYEPASNTHYNLVSSSSFSDSSLDAQIRDTGWQLGSICRQGSRVFAQKWKYKNGVITFIFSTDIINNEYIYLADNILFLRDMIDLSSKDRIIWDVFHQGVFKRANLWYYLFYTIPGRLFLWFLVGLSIYFWYKNTKLRKYPLPKKEREVVGASLVYFDVLASKFSKNQIIQDTYETLKSYLMKKGSEDLFPSKEISLKQKLKEIINYFK